MKKINILGIMALSLFMGMANQSCKTIMPQTKPEVEKTTVKKEAKSIQELNTALKGEWSVIKVNGQTVVGDDRPYIVFDTVATNPFLMKIYAYNGCNVINGMVAINPNGSIKKAGDYLSTMKYCADAQYEVGFSMVLDAMQSFSLTENKGEMQLSITTPQIQQSLILQKTDLNYANGAWKVTRIGDKVLDEDAGIEMVIDLPEGKVHGNAGCNIFNGSITTDPDHQNSIRFSNLVTTRMTCPNLALEQEFLERLAQVTTIERDHSDNAVVLRNQSGTLQFEMKRMEMSHDIE